MSSQGHKRNPAATIGFVIYYPFQFYVYKNIYLQLQSDAEFIVDLRPPYSERIQKSLLFEITKLLDSNSVNYRILYPEDYYQKKYLDTFFSQYKALVSVWERGCMSLASTSHIKKINATYGSGKELTMVRPSRGLYDLILAYGPRDANLFSYFTRSVIVGNPKFDDWFRGTIDRNLIANYKACLDPDKKTILYLPTHSDLSSIDVLSSEISTLTDRYNVLIKVHYFTAREEPGRMKLLNNSGVIVLTDEVDLLPLLAVADVIVSDNSSAIFDAILADKPIVVADFWGADYLDLEHKEVRQFDRGFQGAVTYSDSIEQVIKREGKVPTIKKPHELSTILETGEIDSDFYRTQRVLLRDELFAYRDGSSAARAAEQIKKEIANPAPFSRPILYHAIEAFKRRSGLLSYTREKHLNSELARYKTELGTNLRSKEILFSILYVRNPDSDPDLEYQALCSLISQDFPHDSYEILLCNITAGAFNQTLRERGQKITPRIAIRELGGDGPLSQKVERTIFVARGTYICFASSAAAFPSSWITTHYLTYKKNPETACVGGFVQNISWTMHDAYTQYLMRRQLNTVREKSSSNSIFEVTNQLFNQNPIGELYGTSFKKDCISTPLGDIDDITYLGLQLKLNVMRNYSATFIPQAVWRLKPLTSREFGHIEKTKGFFYCWEQAEIGSRWSHPTIFNPSVLLADLPISKLYGGAFLRLVWYARWMQFAGRLKAVLEITKNITKKE